MKRNELAGKYCLYCYTPLDRGEKSTENCLACGRVDLRSYHTIYWTRERSLIRLEELLKVLVAIVMASLTLFIIPEFIGSKASGAGAGWIIVVPLVAFGMLLWQTVSLVTHQPRYTHVRLIWTLVFLLVPVGPFLFFGGVSISTGGVGSGWFGHYGELWFAVLIPCLLLSALAWQSGDRFERFKRRRIERGAAQA